MIIGLAALAPIALGALLVPLRGDLEQANLALLFVLVVVLAGVAGGRAAGATAAVASTLSFDFFLTQPYLSLRIESAADFETAVILLVVGLLVGQIAVRAEVSRARGVRAADEVARVHRVSEQVAQGSAAEDVALSVIAELTALLKLESCELELAPYALDLSEVGLVRLERTGALASSEHRFLGEGFVLPAIGVELPVRAKGGEIARLVLRGTPGHGVTLDERKVAVALADQLGVALAAATPDELTRLNGMRLEGNA
jgi:hypothetical protein